MTSSARGGQSLSIAGFARILIVGGRCELFNKAYNHISERIDEVYKDLTKGKSAPMGGVAYLSLEDSEVILGRLGRLLGILICAFNRNLILLESSIMLCHR